MRKILFLLAIILFASCEKEEICYCTGTLSDGVGILVVRNVDCDTGEPAKTSFENASGKTFIWGGCVDFFD